MTVVAEKKRRRAAVKNQPVPEALIYEKWGGKPIYYKGYRDVLTGKKTPEEIMSCSDLQGVIVSIINGFLYSAIDRKRYLLSSNESGLHLAKNDNLGNDIAIFEKAAVGKLQGKYFEVSPKVVIEIDIKADVSDFLNQETGYLLDKSQKILDFGAEKIIWILTHSRKIFVADRNQTHWYFTDWSEDIPLLDDCILNVKKLLDEDEIEY